MKMIDERAEERKRVLELNPSHPIVKDLARIAAASPTAPELSEFCELLYDQALLAEGVVEDPARLVAKLRKLLSSATAEAARGLPDPVAAGSSAAAPPAAADAPAGEAPPTETEG